MEKHGEVVRAATADESFAYLGVMYFLWKSIDIGEVKADLAEILRRVKRLALKPFQKLNVIQTYLVPGYLHNLVVAEGLQGSSISCQSGVKARAPVSKLNRPGCKSSGWKCQHY